MNNGKFIDIYRIGPNTINIESGVKNIIYDIIKLKAVFIPKSLERKFFYDLGFLAANNNFTYGGLIEENIKYYLIDNKELRSSFNKKLIELNTSDYIMADHLRGNIVNIEKSDIYSIIKVKFDPKQRPEKLYNIIFEQVLQFNDVLVNTP